MVYFKDEMNDFIVDKMFYEDISYSMSDDKLEEKNSSSEEAPDE